MFKALLLVTNPNSWTATGIGSRPGWLPVLGPPLSPSFGLYFWVFPSFSWAFVPLLTGLSCSSVVSGAGGHENSGLYSSLKTEFSICVGNLTWTLAYCPDAPSSSRRVDPPPATASPSSLNIVAPPTAWICQTSIGLPFCCFWKSRKTPRSLQLRIHSLWHTCYNTLAPPMFSFNWYNDDLIKTTIIIINQYNVH